MMITGKQHPSSYLDPWAFLSYFCPPPPPHLAEEEEWESSTVGTRKPEKVNARLSSRMQKDLCPFMEFTSLMWVRYTSIQICAAVCFSSNTYDKISYLFCFGRSAKTYVLTSLEIVLNSNLCLLWKHQEMYSQSKSSHCASVQHYIVLFQNLKLLSKKKGFSCYGNRDSLTNHGNRCNGNSLLL